jgi:hypothetical protein
LQDRLQCRLDESGGSEKLATLRDIHRSEFTGPRIDILKDMPVDGLKVRSIEPSRQRSRVEFDQPGLQSRSPQRQPVVPDRGYRADSEGR